MDTSPTRLLLQTTEMCIIIISPASFTYPQFINIVYEFTARPSQLFPLSHLPGFSIAGTMTANITPCPPSPPLLEAYHLSREIVMTEAKGRG